MAVHNRRALTVRALRALRRNDEVFDIYPIVFDDASNDGTSEAVASEWPGCTILRGDGKAYWNGAMHAAWQHALMLQVDGYLWLNDDVQLDDDALRRLADEWYRQGGPLQPFVLVGATRDDTGRLSYGGQRRLHSPFALNFQKLSISSTNQMAETFNGNIALISQATVNIIGVNDPNFLHSLGDFDYGLRAFKANIPILVLGGTLGLCRNNIAVDMRKMNIRERFKFMLSPKGMALKGWFHFTRRHSGIYFILHFLLPYRKIFIANKKA